MTDEAQRSASICPYLQVAGGSWRYAHASRVHRCAALAPPTVLAMDKQRRLCLVARHAGCPTYLAARSRHWSEHVDATPPTSDPQIETGPVVGARLRSADPASASRWRFTRPAPVVLDRSGGPSTLAAAIRGRAVIQGALVVLLLVAFAALALGRLPAPGGAAVPSASPSATPAATAEPSPTPPPTPSPSPSPTPAPTATATPSPTPSPTPSATSSRTYIVKFGDTLIGIAARFGTTVPILQELNGIVDASKIRVGQVIQLP